MYKGFNIQYMYKFKITYEFSNTHTVMAQTFFNP